MKLAKEVIASMIEKSGIDVNTPKAFYSLSFDIHKCTGENLSENTLKRMFGVLEDGHKPHRHSLDIVGRYLGCKDWNDLMQKLAPEDSDFSTTLTLVSSADLNPGQVVEFTYEPGRRVKMSLQDDSRFVVISSLNSKIKRGDVVRFSSIALHFPFIASEVVRDGVSLGRFVAGDRFGVTSINVK